MSILRQRGSSAIEVRGSVAYNSTVFGSGLICPYKGVPMQSKTNSVSEDMLLEGTP